MTRELTPKQLKIGMIAIEDIKTPQGQLIAKAGTTLTRQDINKCKLYRVETAIVDPLDLLEEETTEPADETILVNPVPIVEIPYTPQIPQAEVLYYVEEHHMEEMSHTEEAPRVEEKTRVEEAKTPAQKVVESAEFKDFQMEYLHATETLKEVFESLVKHQGQNIKEAELVESIAPLFKSRTTITEVFDMLHHMHAIDDTVYAHCVNVALISRMIGRWLHFDLHDLDVLTCCGLLHDLGKHTIPMEILNKPGKLTDEEFALIKNHPKAGYELVRSLDIDDRIKQACLMHHERYDGSGYPNGLTSEFLPDYSMIIAIADVYDAMTSARSYRVPLCPFQVIENFEKEGFQKYHTKYIYIFLNRIATTYQNNRVMLNDARGAKIVMLNKNYLSKPVVQFDDGECLDLSEQKDLYITKIL